MKSVLRIQCNKVEMHSVWERENRLVKGITKFWEIFKIGWIVILYNFNIFRCPCGCIKNTRNFSTYNTSAFEKN